VRLAQVLGLTGFVVLAAVVVACSTTGDGDGDQGGQTAGGDHIAIMTLSPTSAATPTTTPIPSTPTPAATPTAAAIAATGTATSTSTRHTWYVSRNGNNTSGDSWENAWTEMNKIVWNSVQPGDTIYLDGGSKACSSLFTATTTSPYGLPSPKPGQAGNCGTLYTTTLTLGKSGTVSAPISIRLGQDPDHNGTVVLFGGRLTDLPYCNASSYSGPTRSTAEA
jgi:hypothetical protein